MAASSEELRLPLRQVVIGVVPALPPGSQRPSLATGAGNAVSSVAVRMALGLEWHGIAR
jgi:hypothetical protein